MRRRGSRVEPCLTKLTMHRYIQSHCFASALVEQQHGGFAQTVCVLGLGGGALTGWLLKNLPSLSELTASELDEQVTQLATDYFGLDARDPRLTLRAGDGLEHMAEAKAQGRTFDLLVVDIGRSQSAESTEMLAPPPALRSAEALQLFADVVAPGGVLSITTCGGSTEDLLKILLDLEAAMNASGGGRVFFLQQPKATNRMAERQVIALKSGAPASSARVQDSASLRAFCCARARVFDKLHPATHRQPSALQRVLEELNDADGLRRGQQRTDTAASRSPSGHRLPAGGAHPLASPAGSSAHWLDTQAARAPATMPGAGLLCLQRRCTSRCSECT
jgi:hypothetical protein